MLIRLIVHHSVSVLLTLLNKRKVQGGFLFHEEREIQFYVVWMTKYILFIMLLSSLQTTDLSLYIIY